MATGSIVPLAQICAFVLGCTLIHAARAHAAIVTRVLGIAAIVVGVLITAMAIVTLDDRAGYDEAADRALLSDQ